MKDEIVFYIIIAVLILFAIMTGKSKSNTGTTKTRSNVPLEESLQREKNVQTIQKSVQEIREETVDLAERIKAEQEAKLASVYKDQITISSVSGASSTDPTREYITIRANRNNKTSIDVTGWKFINTTGKSITIGTAVERFYTASRVTGTRIVLKPGEELIVTTGSSPIAYSFKINKCMEYLDSSYDFIPSLNTNCPAPRNEAFYLPPTSVENDRCMQYVRNLSSCRLPFDDWNYSNLSRTCRKFIQDTVGYAPCFNKHQTDIDFLEPEWRFFAGRTKSLWKSYRERITLLDPIGKIVDTYDMSYY